MTIRKGEAWGQPVERPAGLAVAASDAALARLIERDPNGAFTVAGGDLFRTVGSPRAVGATMQRLPIDLLEIVADGRRHTAVAHVVVRRRWWRGAIVFVCNVDHVGTWNVAPRAHPNDGRLDVTDGSISTREWPEFRKRARTGSHLPHPDLSSFAAASWTTEFDKPTMVWTDGVRMGWCRRLEVQVIADAGEIVI